MNVLGRGCQNKEEGNGIQSPIGLCQVSLPWPDAWDELGFYQGHWKLYEKQIAQTILIAQTEEVLETLRVCRCP